LRLLNITAFGAAKTGVRIAIGATTLVELIGLFTANGRATTADKIVFATGARVVPTAATSAAGVDTPTAGTAAPTGAEFNCGAGVPPAKFNDAP
jgi:hypothetical protein